MSAEDICFHSTIGRKRDECRNNTGLVSVREICGRCNEVLFEVPSAESTTDVYRAFLQDFIDASIQETTHLDGDTLITITWCERCAREAETGGDPSTINHTEDCEYSRAVELMK